MPYDVSTRTHSIPVYHEAQDGTTTRLRITFRYEPATEANLFLCAMPSDAWCEAVHVLKGYCWVYADEWWDWASAWVANNMAEIEDAVERDLEFTVFLEANAALLTLATVPVQGNA